MPDLQLWMISRKVTTWWGYDRISHWDALMQ